MEPTHIGQLASPQVAPALLKTRSSPSTSAWSFTRIELVSRREKASTLITSNRGLDDWAKLLGDVVIVAPLIDRLMHHGHLLKFDGKSWRLKEAAARIAKGAADH